jgi:zinc-ribbon domain
MICEKCQKEVEAGSKFCNNCGAKVEEKIISSNLDDTFKNCAKAWFTIGVIWGATRNEKEGREILENALEKCGSFVWTWYEELVKDLENLAQNYEKTHQKAN